MKKLTSLLVSAGLAALPSLARAGNDDGILLGNDAALTAGAVVATVNDGSALWYNPAGLAKAAGSSVDVGATAFALRRYKMPKLIEIEGGDRANASFTEIVSIPSALTYVRRFGPRTVGGLGLFASQLSDYTLRASMSLPLAPTDARMQLLLTEEGARYHVAGGFGMQLGAGFSFGFSLLGDYQDSVSVTQAATTVEYGGPLAAVVSASHEQSKALGFHARVGVIFAPSDYYSLGLSVESPGVYFYRSGRLTGFESSTAPNDAGETKLEFARTDESFSELALGLYMPVRVRFGGALRLGKTLLSAEGDVQSRVKDKDVEVDRVFNWNVRAGARVEVGEAMHLGAGFFTDRGAEKEDQWGAGTVDFYGATIGGQYDSVRWLASSGSPEEPRSNLTFSSTVALRYAYGIGKLPGQYLTTPDFDASTRGVDLTVHEITLHLGSGVYF